MQEGIYFFQPTPVKIFYLARESEDDFRSQAIIMSDITSQIKKIVIVYNKLLLYLLMLWWISYFAYRFQSLCGHFIVHNQKKNFWIDRFWLEFMSPITKLYHNRGVFSVNFGWNSSSKNAMLVTFSYFNAPKFSGGNKINSKKSNHF